MAAVDVKEQQEPEVPPEEPVLDPNRFYRKYYFYFLIALFVLVALLILAVSVVFYQTRHKPLPTFKAEQANGQTMQLTAYQDPNLLPDTILMWASKAATVSYTFDFVNYRAQLELVRPYFTSDGWPVYLASVDRLISTIVANQLFVNGVVAGIPVISNQGPLPGKDYVWRVQIPFLVTYQSANIPTVRRYYVVLTIVRVPTSTNPQGIGIDQFVMVGG